MADERSPCQRGARPNASIASTGGLHRSYRNRVTECRMHAERLHSTGQGQLCNAHLTSHTLRQSATSQVAPLVEQPLDLAVKQSETGLFDQRNLAAAAADVGQGDIDREDLLLVLCRFGDDVAPRVDDM